ncbi:ABC transporter ATP-binding protein/permease [bacterium]|nr:ABC transporter ATP-binding protein/permease [bacterium]
MSQPNPDFDVDSYLDKEEGQGKFHRRTLRRLVGYVLANRYLLAAGIFLILVATAATLLEPRLFGYAIDEALIPQRPLLLKQLVGLFLIIELTRLASVLLHSYLFEKLGQNVMQRLRIELFAHLQCLPVSIFDKHPVGRLVTRVTNDVSNLAEMFSAGFVTIIGNVLVVVGILTWLLILDWELGLIACSVFPFLMLASAYFSKQLRVAYREARSKLSALNAFLAENILGMRVVHLFNRQRLHIQRFKQINDWYANAQIGSVRVFAYFQPAITWSSGVAVALVIWFGGQWTTNGSIKPGVLVAFFSYVLTLFQPLREIADKWNIFLSGMTSAERIFSILDWTPEHQARDSENPVKRPEGIQGHIVFDKVWFAYSGENWVLKDFSLEIKPGMKIGVVGHTGAGKTTLISLLLRFYSPQKGTITLDGRDLKDYSLRELRSIYGMIQQDVFLFSGSIWDNATLWRELGGSLEADLKSVLGSTGLSDLKVELEERGSNLSMGTRQTLAFARAMAANPPVWILDEATANIDSGTEKRLEKIFDHSAEAKTTIMIAHRLSTVRSADLILVLHKGTLVEKGTHTQLLKQDGFYARLYRFQSASLKRERKPATAAAPELAR